MITRQLIVNTIPASVLTKTQLYVVLIAKRSLNTYPYFLHLKNN